MKKKLIKTLLIGAAIGTTLTGLASSCVEACYLSHQTLAYTDCTSRVELHIEGGQYYKKYKSSDYCYYFYDYDPGCCEHTELYCKDLSGNPKTGFLRNGGDCYYFDGNGKAISGERWISGHLYDFDSNTYKGHIVK